MCDWVEMYCLARHFCVGKLADDESCSDTEFRQTQELSVTRQSQVECGMRSLGSILAYIFRGEKHHPRINSHIPLCFWEQLTDRRGIDRKETG